MMLDCQYPLPPPHHTLVWHFLVTSVLIVLKSLTLQASIWWTTGALVAAKAIGLESVSVLKAAYMANRAARYPI
jgi:hypothetical protein